MNLVVRSVLFCCSLALSLGSTAPALADPVLSSAAKSAADAALRRGCSTRYANDVAQSMPLPAEVRKMMMQDNAAYRLSANDERSLNDFIQDWNCGAYEKSKTIEEYLLSAVFKQARNNLNNNIDLVKSEYLAHFALELSRNFNNSPRDIAACMILVATIFEHQGRFEDALPLRSEAESLFKTADPLSHSVLAIEAAYLGGEALGRISLARELADAFGSGAGASEAHQALDVADSRGVPDDMTTAQALVNLAAYLNGEGKFATAEGYVKRMMAIPAVLQEPLGTQSSTTIGMVRRGETLLIQALLGQGRTDEAMAIAKRQIAVLDKLDPRQREDLATLPYVIMAAGNVGMVWEALGSPSEAARYYRQVIQASAAAQLPEEDYQATERQWARAATAAHQPADAEPIQRALITGDESALGVVEGKFRPSFYTGELPSYAGPDAPVVDFPLFSPLYGTYAKDLIDLGQTLMGLNRNAEAATLLDRATVIAQRQIADAVKDGLELSADMTKFRTARNIAAKSLASALWLQTAQSGIESHADETRATMARAFEMAQLGSSNPASDALARSATKVAAADKGLSEQLAERERLQQQRKLLDAKDTPTSNTPGAAGYEQHLRANAEARKIDNALATSSALMHKSFAAYWDLLDPAAVSLPELQSGKLLSHSEALVMFQVEPGERHGLVFAVNDTSAAWAQISLSGDEVKAHVAKLRAAIDPESAPDHRGLQRAGGNSSVFDRQTAYELYHALFGDAAIRSVIGERPVLIVVPSGPLTSLPPGLLVTEPPNGGTAGDSDPQALRATAWLLRSKAIALLPSVSSLRVLRRQLPQQNMSANDPLLAFADPDFGGEPNADSAALPKKPRGLARYFRDGVPIADLLHSLPRLPGTRFEAHALSLALGGKPNSVLLGRDASKAELMARNHDGRLAHVAVLEFATHGLVAGDVSGLAEPALALSAGTRPEDALLLASDAATLKLNAEWVLLSACNTASGDTPGAEGLSGLSRAFFYAGARSLLVSHWRIRDDIAARIVPAMLSAEHKFGLGHAEALRRASLAVLDDPAINGADPAAWAPFTVMGEAAM